MNGANRRVLKTFDSDPVHPVAAKGNSLMLKIYAAEDDAVILTTMNLQNSTMTEFYRSTPPANALSHGLSVLGATDTGFIIHTSTMSGVDVLPGARTNEDLRAEKERRDNATTLELIEAPFDGGEPRRISSSTSGVGTLSYHNGIIYYIENSNYVNADSPAFQSEGNPAMKRMDCVTGQTETLVEDFTALSGFVTDAPRQSVRITSFIDNYAIVHRSSEAIGPVQDGVVQYGSAQTNQYLVDLDSGKITGTDIEIVYENVNENYSRPPVVLADAGDRLLVIGNMTVVNSRFVRQYALISKADYFSSNPNYTMVIHLSQ